VTVGPGQPVRAGDILARLDTAPLELDLQNAQAGLQSAEAHLAQVRAPAGEPDLANARARLVAAQAAYDQLAAGPGRADLAAARAAVTAAQAAYDATQRAAGAPADQLAAAQATLEKARIALQRAQAAYDQVASVPDIGRRPESLALQSATIDYQQAQAAYSALQATAGPGAASAAEQARSNLEAARAALARLESPATAAARTAAQAQVTQAAADLGRLQNGPDPAAVAVAQADVTRARIAVQSAQRNLDESRLVAPFAGTLLEVRAGPGETVAAGAPLVVLADPAALEVRSTVVEEDLWQVQLGAAVSLYFDAQPDLAVTGRVARIVPQRDATADRTAYPVIITLDGAPGAGLLPGMTVDASIVSAHRQNVLRLPKAAARSGPDGIARLQVWQGGHAEPRTVHLGLRGDLYVEVLDGLREGELVVGQ
jgi:HlyD family secretion protein